jgi:centromere/kinetochore protein ZW10
MEQMQGILSKSKYFDVLGLLVSFCLTSVMDDILALPDITEVESHRLSELCRILHALEGLFVDDPEQVRSYVFAAFPVYPCRYSLPLLLGASQRGSNSRIFPNSW